MYCIYCPFFNSGVSCLSFHIYCQCNFSKGTSGKRRGKKRKEFDRFGRDDRGIYRIRIIILIIIICLA